MKFKRIFSASLVGFVFAAGCANAWAAARVESLKGDVSANHQGKVSKLAVGQRLETGTLVTSQTGANAVLRFDDGQVVVVSPATEFKIVDYHFDQASPKNDRSVLELVRGAMRYVSGALGKRSQEAVAIRTPTATMGIRGSDFMAATGSLYLSIGEGPITVTTAGGSASFTKGQIVYIANPGAAPVLYTGAQLPANIASTFSNLGAIPIQGVALPDGSTGYAGNAATGAQGFAAGGVSFAGTAAAVAAIGVAAAIASSNESDSTVATSTTPSTR